MRRAVYYGYGVTGVFYIKVVHETPDGDGSEQQIDLTRSECQKVSKHMQFGKKGEKRVVESVDGKELQ